MLESRSDTHEMVLNTRHTGFIRVALLTGASLIPVVAFDETALLDNVRFPRALQTWCMRRFRANFLVMPYGIGFLPIPRPLPYSLVVGHPIAVPKIEDPSPELVNALHRLYYTSVVELFDRYKGRCGHEADNILLTPPIEPLHTAEWESVLLSEQKYHVSSLGVPATVTRSASADVASGKRKKHHLSLEAALKPVTKFEMFTRFEVIWFLTLNLLIYAVILYRAWPHLSLTATLDDYTSCPSLLSELLD
jgi:hypothetical protein